MLSAPFVFLPVCEEVRIFRSPIIPNFFNLLIWLSILCSMSRARNLALAAGLLAFAGAGLSFPFYMASLKQPVIDSSKPLPPQAIIRGPYINTGSRDIGPDYQSYPKK